MCCGCGGIDGCSVPLKAASPSARLALSMGAPQWTMMCFTHLQMVVLTFLLSSWAFSPLFHKVEQSRCVYPKWASTTWTPHTYSVTSFSLASACCILPFRSDPASYRFWSGSVLLGIGLLSFTVCLSWLQALMGGKHPIAWLVSCIFQTGRVRESHVEIGLKNLKWKWCLLCVFRFLLCFIGLLSVLVQYLWLLHNHPLHHGWLY